LTVLKNKDKNNFIWKSTQNLCEKLLFYKSGGPGLRQDDNQL